MIPGPDWERGGGFTDRGFCIRCKTALPADIPCNLRIITDQTVARHSILGMILFPDRGPQAWFYTE